MRVSKIHIIILALFGMVFSIQAQDAFPLHPPMHRSPAPILPMTNWAQPLDLSDFKASIPSLFKGLSENRIIDSKHSLESFFYKLRLSREGVLKDSVRVLHVGDSHIRGHFFTESIARKLSSYFSSLWYDDFGINGAVARSFNRPDRLDRIKEFQPDLLILSFGTNESHNRRYDPNIHYRQLDELVHEIRALLPDIPIILTTPPGSYERKGRRVYKINPRTDKAVQIIKNYAMDKKMAYWDLFTVVGGSQFACDNWSKAKLLRPDHIHYLPEGYELQADLFCEAIIKAYNEYIIL
ncbi:lipolytic protein G-D-S-L family [Bacteroides coprosuis DSM 18011]|uniref:Lipolytic protein G-D-S-L family n=1 Tax=Bacteroides coprosuis DSM 18011 TaxID=679937 RepID=F3ZPY5_9BACE|nr:MULTISPECIES: SGNH/GDSL hydrolase family protein [Bacteroides]EGJ70427.1 lipolytic protein G-D-S-L family [Bacteroides coprosuis DSM 18011]HJD92982.1 SGNH/GDSL hydrolase family protein [Bacteroides coprosuis]